MKKEARARIKINNILQKAGWRFFDDEDGKANVALESNVKLTKKDIDALGNDFEKTKNGYVDFLLLDKNGFPYAVLEAKSEDKNPLDGKEQARRYAQSLNVRFVILSNGNLHYFWDLEHGNPAVIVTFPTPDSLVHVEQFKPDHKRLAGEKIEEDYIVLTQKLEYKNDPRWASEAERKEFAETEGLKFLRPYQLRAIHALQESAAKGHDRYLFEMATGTGKTLVSAAIIKLFLKTGNAKRVLFLVDRIELEQQAWKNFKKWLAEDYTTVIYKENRDDWRKAEIVVSTVQSLSFNNKYQHLFSPTDFDLLISDESHRSIGGNSRAVFEYFVGFKLGLTATPKNYLKGIDPEKLNDRDPRAWERRQLLDTYKTFGCESGEPTFHYSLLDGVKDGYLINPIVADARTEITTELLSEKGYALMVETEEGREEEQIFFYTDFEKKFFSDKTNQIFCKTFFENALRDPITGEIGKSIVFCVSQKHASKITQILNQFVDLLYPGKYNSDFAVQITSNIPDAQQFTVSFANNNLNGQTRFLEGYQSSKTRVCVTVGMMTTGYDCEDILNLCMMRPIFSPTDFIQIKGRGTRRYSFVHKEKNADSIQEAKVEKEKFKLFDFFANCEYFEEKYNYDEIIRLPAITGAGGGDVDGVPINEVSVFQPDPLKTFAEKTIGFEGMKIDRKLFEKFESTVKNDPFIQKKYEEGDLETVEDYVRGEIFDKPEDYFNLEKLRKAIKSDRRISLREFIEKILGGIVRFKSKDELLEEEFEKFIAIHKPESKYVLPLKNYLKAYITDNEIRDIIERGEYPRLATNPKLTLSDLRELNKWIEVVPDYVKDYVSLNSYM
ncbi:MAG: DEAD/DEAH box helicase family protein [Candidatus Jorgensenbacteria bacterium]|nr:DEAD/DEAH box helicase family protein [Candidatus Jorgensenbacteria bacterium]